MLVHSNMRNDTVNEMYISEGRKDFESLQHEGGMFEERGLSGFKNNTMDDTLEGHITPLTSTTVFSKVSAKAI